MTMAATTATPVDSNISRHRDVVADDIHLLQSKSGAKSSTFRVPRSHSFSLASDQCCTCKVFPKQTKTVELSAFVPSSDTESVGLYCDGVPLMRFPVKDDTILGVKLLPLPVRVDNVGQRERTSVVGAIVIITSLKKGLTIHTVVLEKPVGSSAFLPIECHELSTSKTASRLAGRRLRSMTATVVDPSENERPRLLVAIASSLDGSTLADQDVDVMSFNICNHKCGGVFQFDAVEVSQSPQDTAVVNGK